MAKVEFWFDRPQKICDILAAIQKAYFNEPTTGDLSKGYGFAYKNPQNKKDEVYSLFVSEKGMSFEWNGGIFFNIFGDIAKNFGGIKEWEGNRMYIHSKDSPNFALTSYVIGKFQELEIDIEKALEFRDMLVEDSEFLKEEVFVDSPFFINDKPLIIFED